MKETNKKTYIAIIVVLAVALAAALAYIIASQLPGRNAEKPDKPAGTESAQPGQTFGIETEYGFLPYPEQWKDHLKADKRMEGENLVVDLSTEAEGNTIPLFTVTIGEIDDAPVGTLTDPNGKVRTVYLTVHDLPDLSSYDEETQDRIFAMQEALNDMIAGLK